MRVREVGTCHAGVAGTFSKAAPPWVRPERRGVPAAARLASPAESWVSASAGGGRQPGGAVRGGSGQFEAVPGLPDSASQRDVARSDFSFAKHLCLPTDAGLCIYSGVPGPSARPGPPPPALTALLLERTQPARGSLCVIKTGLGFVGCQSINQSAFNYQASDGRVTGTGSGGGCVFWGNRYGKSRDEVTACVRVPCTRGRAHTCARVSVFLCACRTLRCKTKEQNVECISRREGKSQGSVAAVAPEALSFKTGGVRAAFAQSDPRRRLSLACLPPPRRGGPGFLLCHAHLASLCVHMQAFCSWPMEEKVL